MRAKNRASIDFESMLVSDASLRCSKWFSEERVMAGDRCRSVEIVAGGSGGYAPVRFWEEVFFEEMQNA